MSIILGGEHCAISGITLNTGMSRQFTCGMLTNSDVEYRYEYDILIEYQDVSTGAIYEQREGKLIGGVGVVRGSSESVVLEPSWLQHSGSGRWETYPIVSISHTSPTDVWLGGSDIHVWHYG